MYNKLFYYTFLWQRNFNCVKMLCTCGFNFELFGRHRQTHYLGKFNEIKSCAPVVLTLKCFGRHRQTHYLGNFNDNHSCATVFKKLQSYSEGSLSACNQLMCCEEFTLTRVSLMIWQWPSKHVLAGTNVWFIIHTVVHKCWLIDVNMFMMHST